MVTSKKCGYADCQNKLLCRERCWKHYYKDKKSGNLPPPKRYAGSTVCSVCGDARRSNGTHRLCRVHYNEFCHKYRAEHREKILESKRKSRKKRRSEDKKSLLRDKANGAVRRAKLYGRITEEPCMGCNAKEAQAHHDSYKPSDWLNVRWLCKECHNAWHRENEPAYPLDA